MGTWYVSSSYMILRYEKLFNDNLYNFNVPKANLTAAPSKHKSSLVS